MVIVDSSVWIDYLQDVVNPQTDWLELALGHEEIGLTSLNLCEILQGVRSEVNFAGLQESLTQFPVFDVCNSELALAAARNYRALRSRGITVRSTIDCIVATFCIQMGYRLLHRDRDYDPFETYLGLDVLHASSGPRGLKKR